MPCAELWPWMCHARPLGSTTGLPQPGLLQTPSGEGCGGKRLAGRLVDAKFNGGTGEGEAWRPLKERVMHETAGIALPLYRGYLTLV